MHTLDGVVNQAIFRFDTFVERATRVGHPCVVHLIITARCDPVNFTFSTPYLGIRANTTFGANTVCPFQEPNTHFEAKICARQSANRADVYCVERIVMRKFFSGEAGQGRISAAIDKSKYVVIGHFLTKTDATRTKNATFIIEYDIGT